MYIFTKLYSVFRKMKGLWTVSANTIKPPVLDLNRNPPSHASLLRQWQKQVQENKISANILNFPCRIARFQNICGLSASE